VTRGPQEWQRAYWGQPEGQQAPVHSGGWLDSSLGPCGVGREHYAQVRFGILVTLQVEVDDCLSGRVEIKDLADHFAPVQRVALVGASGSGKSILSP